MREDWIVCKIGDVFNFVGGGTPSTTNENYWNGDIPWASIKDIKGDFLISTINKITQEGLTNSSSNLVAIDEVILATRINPGKPIIAKINTSINQDLKVVKPKVEIPSVFVFYLFKFLEKRIIGLSSGTTVLGIGLNPLKDINFSLPPLPEQRAIVKKLESLFSSLDAGVADLKKAQQQLKIYRQAVLKKAFEGELTKEWRSKQNNLPSSDEISKLITDERASFYKIQLDEWEKEVEKWKEATTTHKKPTRPSKFSNPDLPTSEQESDKWSIPNGWIWTQVGEICFVTKLAGFEYSDYVKYTDDGDLPVLKAENVGNNGFKPTIYSKVDFNSVSMLKRTYLNGGELLIVFVGAGTGKVGLVPYNKKFFLGPNIGMARPYFKLNGKYLEYFYQCLLGKKLLMATVKAVAQPSLSMGSIRQSPFVMCSLEEQNEIVKQIESRLSVCDSIEQNIKESLEKAEVLRQSILKKAFEGNLLTAQELAECKLAEDYEPAGVLLEKMKMSKK